MTENNDYQQLKTEIEKRKQERILENKKRRIKEYLFVGILLAVIIVLIVGLSIRNSSKNKSEGKSKNPAKSESISSADSEEESTAVEADAESVSAEKSVSKAEKKAKTTKKNDNLSALENQINSALSGFSGEWSVYVKNLDSGKSISINNRQIYAASLIKLFAMSSAYQQVSEGILQESEIYDIIYPMITQSSNEDFNSVVLNVGQYYITDWCREKGFSDTIQCHGLYPADNGDLVYNNYGSYNVTTVEDCGKLLESIYKGKCVSKEYSQKMVEILSKQELVNKIPEGVPKKVKVANKTGETEDVCHDAAIVYSPGADYILTVMVDNPGDAYSNTDDVVKISEIVYNYFNIW